PRPGTHSIPNGRIVTPVTANQDASTRSCYELYAPFEEVRRHTKAMDKREAYNALRESNPELGLPPVGKADEADEAMRVWESSHRDQLTASEIEDTHFFGFAGQSVLAKLIDFVFVSADLRAYEQTDDAKATALARIIDHSVNRGQASERLGEVEKDAHLARQRVHEEVYGDDLQQLSAALTREVAEFTTGREITVVPVVQAPRTPKTVFETIIKDGAAETAVDKQGHGFQRTLIVAALKFLAERRRPEGGTRTFCLAVEEPELFQHPPQARVFAEVLRGLVRSGENGRTQVMYATHSPLFIDPEGYHQIRRLSRDAVEAHPVTRVWQASEAELCAALSGLVDTGNVSRRMGPRLAGSLSEAFFAHAAVLVEGTTDQALLTGCAERLGVNLGAEGIVFTEVTGKDNILLCHAILGALGLPCHVVFDADAGGRERKLESVRHLPDDEQAKKAADFDREAARSADQNASLLGYLGQSTAPWPTTGSSSTHTVFEDTLETYLADHWPAWGDRCRELQAELGPSRKNAAVYREAARTAASGPPYVLQAALENIRALAR
ncbi:ATP-dependent nuclease, partial [Streptomyces fradiae]|uniref:ATP-dependent nuclease n=1 Tax=Streptomyces fradiae TaxID=1906 RepID=UPI00380D9F9D